MQSIRILALLVALAPSAALAQSAAGKPLTQDTYDSWRVVQGSTISPDGRWAAYTLTPIVGDGELVVRSTSGATEHRLPRGFTGRPQLVPNADSGFTAPPPQFTADSRRVLALVYAPQAEFDRARRDRRRPSTQPKASLAIVDVATGAVTTVPRVKSFRIPKDNGRWAAYLLDAPDGSPAAAAKDDSARAATAAAAAPMAAATPGGEPRPVSTDTARRAPRKDEGTVLVLRDLTTGVETRIEDVTSYTFDDAGGWLGYTVASDQPSRDGAYVRVLGSGREIALRSGHGSYKSLTFDRAGTQAAFIAADGADERPRYTLYHARLGGTVRAAVAPGALDGMHVAEKGRVEFTRDGSALLFGIAPPPLDSIPADSLADKAVFDLWHWKDVRLQPQQRREAARDRDRSFAAIWFPRDGRAVRLATDSVPRVTVSESGTAAIGMAELPYAVERMWAGDVADAVVIDARTGRRTRIAERLEFDATLSPGGRFALWFRDGRWRAYEVATGRTRDLTGALTGVRFDRETWDTPSAPAPWGIAGWTAGDRSVLVYDRYDVWELDPTGARRPRMVTDSLGTRQRLVLRVVDLDPDERTIDPARPLLLRAFDDSTKASGFYRDRLGVAAAPERIVMADASFGTPRVARAADAYLVTRETFHEYPDLWAGPSLDRLTRISNANPQQAEYAWGSVELVRWRSDDGMPLQGLLYKPAGFDPSRQYPMVVYFYERLSDNLHRHHVPAGRNVVNPSVYASLGYLVFFPDIAYQTGYPGQSALKSIVPGVQSLIARGFVKPDAVASAGQSWGGYQTAYMITQTRLFRAAFAGAPVANMTSAYGGIRWESGLARSFQYERTQSRIGGSIWEYPTRYLENSPLFYADRVETPLLIMHNDADGAVPWYQGIELFVALRRNGKEAYLINYNGDGHNPRKRANQKDIDLRMQQFFAHHLKGEPAPDWMREGIPFLQKGRDQITPPATATEGATGAPTGNGRP